MAMGAATTDREDPMELMATDITTGEATQMCTRISSLLAREKHTVIQIMLGIHLEVAMALRVVITIKVDTHKEASAMDMEILLLANRFH